MYTQCNFKKVNDPKVVTQGWIPRKYAKVGLHVTLEVLGKDFWEITYVGASKNEDPSINYRTWNNNI
jgi:hypothetical protein